MKTGLIAVLSTLSLAASASTATAPAPTISIAPSTYIYTKGTTIAPITPVVTGAVSVSVSPNIADQTGLTYNGTTGVVSGTPSTPRKTTTYTLTAVNSAGKKATASVAVTVNDIAPTLSVAGGPFSFLVGAKIEPIVPTLGPSATSVAILPGLQSTGLSFNTNNGKITGTPTAAQLATSYTLTASNVTGQTASTQISIQLKTVVAAVAPPPAPGPGCEYTLSIADFQSTSALVSRQRVFAGATELFLAADGFYHVPLTDSNYRPIVDTTGTATVLNGGTLPVGVWEVNRKGTTFTAGNSGHQNDSGSSGYVSYVNAATINCNIVKVVNVKGADGFEDEVDGTSIVGDAGDDQYAVTGNVISAESSTTTAADLYTVTYSDVCKGVVCTASDPCHVAGTCDPGSGLCTDPPAVDGATCNDGNNCTTNDVCTAGVCAGAPVVCTAADQCHAAGSCGATSGQCSNPALPDGTACTLAGAPAVCATGTCIVPLSPPTNLSAFANPDGSMRVLFTGSSDATGYQLWRRSSSAPQLTQVASGTASPLFDPGPLPSAINEYLVIALAGASSATSAPIDATGLDPSIGACTSWTGFPCQTHCSGTQVWLNGTWDGQVGPSFFSLGSNEACAAYCSQIPGVSCSTMYATWAYGGGACSCFTGKDEFAMPGWDDMCSATCIVACPAGQHDGGDGSCIASGCSSGYHDGGSGSCVAVGTCSSGYQDGGAGQCVPAGTCSSGYHDGGSGSCVAVATCSSGYQDGGNGSCVPAGSCATGYHDGGDGTCLGAGLCSSGYHDGGYGFCQPAGVCTPGYILPANQPGATVNGALLFDGVSNDVAVLNPAGLPSGSAPFTMEAWFNANALGAWQRVLFYGDPQNWIHNTGFGISPDGLLSFVEDGITEYTSGGPPIAAGSWNHGAVTYDGQTLTLWLNGAAAGTWPNVTLQINPSTMLEISGKLPNANTVEKWSGAIDDVRLWSVALTQAEIQAGMDIEALPQAGLIGSWTLDEGTGTVAGDSSGNGNDGTLVNSPAWIAGAPALHAANCVVDPTAVCSGWTGYTCEQRCTGALLPVTVYGLGSNDACAAYCATIPGASCSTMYAIWAYGGGQCLCGTQAATFAMPTWYDMCSATCTCPLHSHDGGGGQCVPVGSCSPGYHDGGSGACVPGAFVPASLSNLFVWLEADVGLQLSGASVAQWNDQSGNGLHAFQPTAAQQPQAVAGALNGLPVVTFDGVSQTLRWPSSSAMTAWSVFDVYQLPTSLNYTSVNYHPLSFGGPVNAPGLYGGIEIGGASSGDADAFDVFGGFGDDERATLAGISASGSGTPYRIIDWVTSGDSHNTSAFADGVAAAMSPTGSAATWNVVLGTGSASDFGAIGACPVCGGVDISPVNHAEIAVFNRALSDVERQQVEGYLAWKWGLQGSLPPDHPYKSAAP